MECKNGARTRCKGVGRNAFCGRDRSRHAVSRPRHSESGPCENYLTTIVTVPGALVVNRGAPPVAWAAAAVVDVYVNVSVPV